MNLTENLIEFTKKQVPYVIQEWDGAKWLYVVDKEGLQHYHYGSEDDPFSRVPDGLVFFKPIDEITEEDMTPFFDKIPGFKDIIVCGEKSK